MLMIRDLNNNGCMLKVYADEQGDIYVALGPDAVCRIGGPASGHTIPVGIRRKLMALVKEWEKYPEVMFEDKAYEMEQEKVVDYEIEFKREETIQSIADILRIMPFDVDIQVKKNPKGIKIIYEVTREQMNDVMEQVKKGGKQ